jgi:hypothetical protein
VGARVHRHRAAHPALDPQSDLEIITEYLHGMDVDERHRAPEGLTFTYGSAVEDALHCVRGKTTALPPRTELPQLMIEERHRHISHGAPSAPDDERKGR